MPRYQGRRRAYRSGFRRVLRRVYPRRNPKNKYSPRRFRKRLLSDTTSNTHYRSLWTTSTTQSAPATPVNITVTKYPALPLPSVQPFWTTPAALPVDTGNAVPGFGRNIVIRGGRIILSVSLRTSTPDTVKARVWLIYRKPCTDDTLLPSSSSTNAWTWDPSVTPDFTRYGRVLRTWQAILEPTTGSCSFQVFHTLRPQKIDHENFEQKGQTLEWVVGLHKLSNIGAAVAPTDVQYGHSLSFSGDEIS